MPHTSLHRTAVMEIRVNDTSIESFKWIKRKISFSIFQHSYILRDFFRCFLDLFLPVKGIINVNT